ncbi:MAG: flagellar basal body P-ring formation chaperone FlgA [Dissulfurimicrobium sp.]|uniref:flagellar basal body P-ring formation chaperone FlgA n=1 Tax=Dissulfurimicrobium sp. TaxID=2022436 RepID=UPI004049D9C7
MMQVVRRKMLLNHIVVAVFVLFATLFTGLASATAVFRPGQPAQNVITAEELEPFFRQEILRRLPWQDAEMEIRRFQIFPSEVAIPDGKVDVEIEAPAGQRPLGMFTCIFTIKVNGKIERRIRGCGFVEIYRPVVCVTRALPRGHILAGDDIKLIRQPVSRIYDDFFDNIKAVSGLVLTRSVRPEQVLTSKIAVSPMMVHCGDLVTIVAESPVFTITTNGKAMEDGSVGRLIRVKNLMSRREVVGIVKDSRTVCVHF